MPVLAEEKNYDALRTFAFIDNFKTMNVDLMATCDSTDISITKIINIFMERQKTNTLIFCKSDGSKCTGPTPSARLAYYDTGYTNKKGENIFGCFKKNNRGWTGIDFYTKDEITEGFDTFDCGRIKIKPFNDAKTFFDQLSEMAIPETWIYKMHKSTIPHPVLKSYIENTFYKLIHEQKGGADKIVLNDTHLLFNTGLLDKFFHDIYIIAELSNNFDDYLCFNPKITTGFAKLKEYGGFHINGKPINKAAMMPKKAEFFKEFHEVVFNIELEVDKDYDRFQHIIEENRDRFPAKYANDSSDELARRVDNAIDDAILMAERNYKFIVPQYRPCENKIQFLMPLYLDGKFNEAPDLALVLDLVKDISGRPELGYYVPETVLYLDAAYQNARLIAKPDNQWLDPKKIQFSE